MAMLHFFGGEKGGVGKSFVARTAVQYHLDRKMDFALFDADRSTADVKRTYQSVGCGDAIFSESEKYEDEANSIYLEAGKKTTLVNLPPNIMTSLQHWFNSNSIFELSEKDGVGITHWFVCSGEPTSVRLLGKYLSYFQGKINHILVKNLMPGKDWELLEEDDFIQQKINVLIGLVISVLLTTVSFGVVQNQVNQKTNQRVQWLLEKANRRDCLAGIKKPNSPECKSL